MTADEPRILIATPVAGSIASASVAVGYHQAVLGLVRDRHFRVLPCAYGRDVVRVRSRLVRQVLADSAATHVLWWDSDVTIGAEQAGRLVSRLVSIGEPFVGCTYPKKAIHWDRLGEVDDGREPEDDAYDYPISLAADARADARGCVEVEGLPLGFALCRRDMLEAMAARYAAAETFLDVAGPERAPTVALFGLVRTPDGLLLGEDYSFAWRWRQMGGKVLLYVGPDCELGHVGAHLFQGSRAGFCR